MEKENGEGKENLPFEDCWRLTAVPLSFASISSCGSILCLYLWDPFYASVSLCLCLCLPPPFLSLFLSVCLYLSLTHKHK